MKKSSLNEYFEKHESQLQVAWFLIFGLLALVVQLGSRIACDVALQGLTQSVTIWPFPTQALGSFLAFLISNVLAKVISFITNRKKTFQANNNIYFSVIVYIIVVVALILIETIIGTPLQNGIYGLLGGAFSGTAQTTAAAMSPALYQASGVAAQLIYGIGDAVIIFFMDKYVIMRKVA